jgi:hypothetical protein
MSIYIVDCIALATIPVVLIVWAILQIRLDNKIRGGK